MLKCPYWELRSPSVTAHSHVGAEAFSGISITFLLTPSGRPLTFSLKMIPHIKQGSLNLVFLGTHEVYMNHKTYQLQLSSHWRSMSKIHLISNRGCCRGEQRHPWKSVWGRRVGHQECPGFRPGPKHPPPLWPGARLLTSNSVSSHL